MILLQFFYLIEREIGVESLSLTKMAHPENAHPNANAFVFLERARMLPLAPSRIFSSIRKALSFHACEVFVEKN